MPKPSRRTRRLGGELLLVTLCGAILSGCASAPEPDTQRHSDGHFAHGRNGGEGRGGEGRRGEGHDRLNLFISPMGQPFRAPPEAAYAVAQWFAAADSDHDGRLARAEFLAEAQAWFHVLDADGDGVIDGPELTLYETRIAPEILRAFTPNRGDGPRASGGSGGGGGGGRHGGGRGGGGGGRGGSGRGGGGGGGGGGGQSSSQTAHAADETLQGAAGYSFLPIPEPVASADRNLDGRITLDEFLATARERFEALDTAHAGYLTLDTLPRTPAQGPRPN